MKHQVTSLLALISVFICGLMYAQPLVFTNPDKILHLAAEDSLANFGDPVLGNSIVACNINDDAYEDLAVSAPVGKNLQGQIVGNVYVYFGSANGVSITPDQIIYGLRELNNPDPFGGCLVGDFNNDNHQDLVVGYEHYNTQGNVSQGYAICFFGKNDGTGIDTTNKLIIEAQGGSGNFAHSYAKGDFNDDEADDLLISAIHDAGYTGRIYCYYGGTNFDEIPDLTFSRDGSTVLGSNILQVSDVNNDSFDDIIALDVPGWNLCSLQISIFEGANPMNPQPMYVHGFDGMVLLQANDINGDGFDDIIGTSPNGLNCNGTAPYHYITLIKGSAEYSLDSFLLIPFQGQVAMPSNFENSIDVNNDGINDIFMTIKKDDGTKESYIFAGHPTDYLNITDTLFKFVDTDNSYGNTIENIIPADCNGDGKPEFYGYSQLAPYKSVIFVYENMPQIEKIFFSAKPTSEDFYSIYSMNIDGSNKAQLFSDNYHRRCPIISKDHSEIFYLKRINSIEGEGDSTWICKSRIDGTDEQILWTNSTPEEFGIRTNFDVSSDNNKILYAVNDDGSPDYLRDGDIFEFDLNSQSTINLTNDWDFVEEDPVYSPSELKIVYTKNGTTWSADPWPMYRMNTDGTGNELFQPNGDGHYSRPEFSPDGAKFTFCYAPVVGMPYSMYVANGDGTGPQQIIPSAGSSSGLFDPTFNPSGTQLAFASENNSQLVITDLTGNILQQIDTIGINGFFEIEWGVVGGSGLPDPASPITGPTGVCQGETGVQFSIEPIANATGYVWTLPEGAIIVGGENSTTITVNFSTTAVSGNISVYGTNANGNGDPSPDFFVKVNPLPADIGELTGNTNTLNDGLVAYYPFNGNANDESGNGNNGVVNGATLTEDRFGSVNSAYSFDGIDDVISFFNKYIFHEQTDASLSLWIFHEGGEGQRTIIYSRSDELENDRFHYYSDHFGNFEEFNYNYREANSTLHPLGGTSLSLQNWIQFVFTRSNNSYSFYKDGQLIINTLDMNPNLPTTTGWNLAGKNDYGNRFQGKIDDLRIYNRALTPEEVACLYTGNCTEEILSAELTNNSICENESTSIEIFNAQQGISYQLIQNQANYGEPQVGSGDTLVFPVSGLKQTSNFQILATDAATGCFITLDTTLVVTVFAINSVVSADTAICAGSPVTLSASGGDSYLWSNGMTTPEITVSPEITTTYSVTISNDFGCSETHDILVTVHPMPLDIGQSTGLGNSLNDGLVAYYPFNGNADDESGNGNNGQPDGIYSFQNIEGRDALHITGECGNSWPCAYGNGGHVDLPMLDFSNMADFSISEWVFEEEMLIEDGEGYVFYGSHSDAHVGIGNFGSLQFYAGTKGVSTPYDTAWRNQWMHYLMVVKEDTLTAFINDSIIGIEVIEPFILTLDSAAVGKHWWYWFSTRLTGAFDDLRIYNRALTSEEVTCLYTGNCTGGMLSAEVINNSICEDESTSIEIINAQQGISYQLIQNQANYGEPQVGNGDTLVFPVSGLVQTSNFEILATDTATGCFITLDTTLVVNVFAINALVSADTAICAGSPVTLSASGGDSYLWNNGMTTPEITVTPESTTTFSVTISNNFGCSETHEILVTVHPLPLDIEQSTGTGNSLNEGLVAYYPFDGDATDMSGNGNHGTLEGPTPAPDRFGNPNGALNFEGINNPQIVYVPNSASLQFTNQASFCYWFSLDKFFGMNGWGQPDERGVHVIFSKDYDQCCMYSDIYSDASNNLLGRFFSDGFVNNGIGIDDTIPEGDTAKWIHLSYVVHPNYCEMYVNGMLVDTTHGITSFESSNSRDLYFGRLSSFWYPFDGKLDDVRFYNRALTAEEVTCLYSGDCFGTSLAVNLASEIICSGGETSLNIYNSQTGIEYQLTQNGSNYGDLKVGNGGTLTFPFSELTQTSTFEIQATDPLTDCMIALDTTLTISVVNVTAKANASAISEFVPATVNCSSLSEGAVTWEWFIDGTLFSNQPQPQLIIEEPGEHKIVLSVNSGPPANCSDSDTVIIITQEIIQVDILIPSSFTPNNDNINDKLEIVFDGAASADVWIKDQWGVLLKEYDGLAEKWNGLTASGKEAPAAPYFCIVEATDKAGGTHEKQGIVYLFRDDVDVSPNPASKQVLVQTNGRIPGERVVKIYSPMGETMLEMKPSTDDFEIDLSQFQPGIYFLQISNGIDQLTSKIIKQ